MLVQLSRQALAISMPLHLGIPCISLYMFSRQIWWICIIGEHLTQVKLTLLESTDFLRISYELLKQRITEWLAPNRSSFGLNWCQLIESEIPFQTNASKLLISAMKTSNQSANDCCDCYRQKDSAFVTRFRWPLNNKYVKGRSECDSSSLQFCHFLIRQLIDAVDLWVKTCEEVCIEC